MPALPVQSRSMFFSCLPENHSARKAQVIQEGLPVQLGNQQNVTYGRRLFSGLPPTEPTVPEGEGKVKACRPACWSLSPSCPTRIVAGRKELRERERMREGSRVARVVAGGRQWHGWEATKPPALKAG